MPHRSSSVAAMTCPCRRHRSQVPATTRGCEGDTRRQHAKPILDAIARSRLPHRARRAEASTSLKQRSAPSCSHERSSGRTAACMRRCHRNSRIMIAEEGEMRCPATSSALPLGAGRRRRGLQAIASRRRRRRRNRRHVPRRPQRQREGSVGNRWFSAPHKADVAPGTAVALSASVDADQPTA